MVEENQVNASKFNFPDEKNVFLKTLLETTEVYSATLPRLHKTNRLTLELRKVSITNGDDKAALKKKTHLNEAHTASNWTNTIFYRTLNRILVSCLLFSSPA